MLPMANPLPIAKSHPRAPFIVPKETTNLIKTILSQGNELEKAKAKSVHLTKSVVETTKFSLINDTNMAHNVESIANLSMDKKEDVGTTNNAGMASNPCKNGTTKKYKDPQLHKNLHNKVVQRQRHHHTNTQVLAC